MITDSGLPGVLFSMLDTETDARLMKDIHDTLTSMLQVLAADNLSLWLSLCKDVLTISGRRTTNSRTTLDHRVAGTNISCLRPDSSAEDSGNGANGGSAAGADRLGAGDADADADGEEDDDQEEFHATEEKAHPAVQPRWPTRVFAAECVRRIILACHATRGAHFDLALAKEMQLTKTKGTCFSSR